MIPIVGQPTAPFMAVKYFAMEYEGWYLKAVTALWDTGLHTGIDPVVLAAQCGHETGYGRFGGAVTPEHGNTCGLKIRNPLGDTPEDHARFAVDPHGYPRVGALAHAHHLRLYAGLPVPDDTPDPRAVWIKPGSAAYGSADTVEQLGTRWAPSPGYGLRIADIVRKIQGA